MAQAPTTSHTKKTNPLLKPVQFVTEVQREIKKVTWPTRRETVTTTIMVLILVVIASLILFTADQIIAWGIKTILQVKN